MNYLKQCAVTGVPPHKNELLKKVAETFTSVSQRCNMSKAPRRNLRIFTDWTKITDDNEVNN